MANRFPVWLRAIGLGLLVSGLPTMLWSVLATVNLRTTPAIPWSAAAMAVVLWFYWRYLRGDGPPSRTAAIRNELLRGAPLKPQMGSLALVAGGSAVAAVWAAFGALRGLFHLTPAAGNDLPGVPFAAVIAAIIMSAAVAGVAEESGFRGYMQVPMERAYGPGVAIGITSIVFTAAHLTHGPRIVPMLPFIFVVSVVYGAIAYLSGSIVPSMVLHFVGDAMLFGMRYIAARSGAHELENGVIAAVPAAAFVVFAVMSAVMFRMIARQKRESDVQLLSAA